MGGFSPNSLLSGDAADVLRYNCLPGLLSALFNIIFGIPLIGYFGDSGALIPYELSKDSVGTFVEFCTTFGIRLKKSRQMSGGASYFWDYRGNFRRPGNEMTLRTKLHPQKAKTLIAMLGRIVETGSIAHKVIESAIGGSLRTNIHILTDWKSYVGATIRGTPSG